MSRHDRDPAAPEHKREPEPEPGAAAAGDAHERDALVRGVRLRDARERRGRHEGEPSVGARLAQIGVLGWIVVTPTLLGIVAGRWLDARFGSGLFWTGPLLLVGIALGSWSAWRWARTSLREGRRGDGDTLPPHAGGPGDAAEPADR
ncbi:MAG: AtpZ/AtpI family protein [Lautropia sp.]